MSGNKKDLLPSKGSADQYGPEEISRRLDSALKRSFQEGARPRKPKGKSGTVIPGPTGRGKHTNG